MIGDVIRALGQNPTESEVKKLVHEHRADERVTFEVFLPILQVRQGTLFTREGYGTISAVVNQLYLCTNFVFIVVKAFSTVG